MTVVVGIRFKDSGKIYYFAPGELELQQGEMVIVETVRGPELAKVAFERRDVPTEELVGELKPVVRHAEDADFERMRLLQSRHDEVMERCAAKIRDHKLPMSLVKAEYSFDGSRLTFYFTAEKRVDFRMLVRDLARTFRSRIELRQIGPRDEAKLLGGIGPCGRLLCCATFLPDYARVSIKMAKDQDLPLNPSKISGVCGRLLCCLSYEHEQYVEMRAELPRKGTWVKTPDGPGEVIGVNVLKRMLTVQLKSSGMFESYSPEQLQAATAQVQAVARSRAQEGITPATAHDADDNNEMWPPDERTDAPANHNDEVLEALAWLEGASNEARERSDHTPPHQDSRSDPATKSSDKRSRRRTRKRPQQQAAADAPHSSHPSSKPRSQDRKTSPEAREKPPRRRRRKSRGSSEQDQS